MGTFEQTPEVQAMSAEEIEVRSAMELLGFEDQDGERWYDRDDDIAVERLYLAEGHKTPVAWSTPVRVVTPQGSRTWPSLRDWPDGNRGND